MELVALSIQEGFRACGPTWEVYWRGCLVPVLYLSIKNHMEGGTLPSRKDATQMLANLDQKVVAAEKAGYRIIEFTL